MFVGILFQDVKVDTGLAGGLLEYVGPTKISIEHAFPFFTTGNPFQYLEQDQDLGLRSWLLTNAFHSLESYRNGGRRCCKRCIHINQGWIQGLANGDGGGKSSGYVLY